MYATQASIDPSLAALLQTAQMVTPDQTPTVAAQVAQAAQQKMQPQGITQGMPQAQQDYQNAMPSMMRNMQQQQMQQMVQQAMQQKPAGIEGLPSNVRMAEGGVVGYAGDTDGSLVGGPRRIDFSGDIPIYAPREDKESGETEAEYRARKAREAVEAQGERPIPRGLRWIEENILRPMSQMGGQRMAEMRGTPETPAAKPAPVSAAAPIPEGSDRRLSLPPGGIISPGMAAAPAPQAPAPRPTAQRSPASAQTAQPASMGIASTLPVQPTLAGAMSDVEKIMPGTGTEPNRAALEELQRLRRERPASGIGSLAALQEEARVAEELKARRAKDAQFQGMQEFLLGVAGGGPSGGAQRGGAFRKSQEQQEILFAQEATIRAAKTDAIKEANEARKVGDQEKYVEALNKLSELERADKQVKASLAANTMQSQVQIRAQDIQAREGELNRAQNERLERIRRATANQPGEAERIFNEYTRRKAIDPKDAEDYLTTIDRIKGSGRGISERQDVNELKALITSLKDQADPLKNFDKSSREQASVLLKQAQDKLAQMSGLGGGGTGSQAPMYAKNPKTNERIMSTDGGQTWKPAQ